MSFPSISNKKPQVAKKVITEENEPYVPNTHTHTSTNKQEEIERKK